eukprot:g3373.t1
MKEYEILTRSSIFCVKSRNENGRLRWLTAAHSIRPGLFRDYFPDECWKFVGPEHIRFQLEFRGNETGEIIAAEDFCPQAWIHPTHDVAMLQLADEDAAIDRLASKGIEVCPLIFPPSDLMKNGEGDSVAFLGHFLNESAEDPNCHPEPRRINGEIVHIAEDEELKTHAERARQKKNGVNQTIVRGDDEIAKIATRQRELKHCSIVAAESPLSFGMCGGPIIKTETDAKTGLVCMGILESAIASGPIRGHAVMVSHTILDDFLQDADNECLDLSQNY